MKLNELIKSNHWLSVKLTLLGIYPDQKEIINEYQNVYEKLQSLEPENDEMEIVLTEYDSDEDEETGNGTYVDVSGRKATDNPDFLTDSYALEFNEWRKWLGMNLSAETIENFSELEIIAHCLYEMTFVDYDEDEIKKQFDEIKGTIEEYKNLSDEEKKTKTISLDELKKRYDQQGGS